MNIIRHSNTGDVHRLNLHDAEIGELICNYFSKTLKLFVVLHSTGKEKINANLFFEDVSFIKITLNEPWGEGFYINEVSINNLFEDTPKESFGFTILLNSGDKIEIATRTMTFTEDV